MVEVALDMCDWHMAIVDLCLHNAGGLAGLILVNVCNLCVGVLTVVLFVVCIMMAPKSSSRSMPMMPSFVRLP